MTNEVTRTAPQKIWLCVSDDECDLNEPYPERYPDDNGVTWSVDKPVACTVGYVREDKVAALRKVLLEVSGGISDMLAGQKWVLSPAILDRIDAALKEQKT